MNASVVRRPTTAREAIEIVQQLRRVCNHVFWTDGAQATDISGIADRIQGYRQIQDAHLVALATVGEVSSLHWTAASTSSPA